MALCRLLFRAYYYMELIARFGDVPWVEHILGDSDTEVAYGPRTPRKEVAEFGNYYTLTLHQGGQVLNLYKQ